MANVTGQVSPEAKVAIKALEPDTLCLGDNSLDVKKLQRALSELHLFNSAVDGNFGLKTANAVRRAQRHLGLEETGVFNQNTWYGMSFWSNDLVMDEPSNSEWSLSSMVQAMKQLLGVHATS